MNSTQATSDDVVAALSRVSSPDSEELASQIISLLSISVLSMIMGSKTGDTRFGELSVSRILIMGLYIWSWAFTIIATILVSTNNHNYISCILTSYTCDVFYAGTKMIIYQWLSERIWLVTAFKTSRLKTWQYKFHLFLQCPYAVLFVLGVIYRITIIDDDGICSIGLQPTASIPLMVYDFVFNLYLTILFLRPILTVGRGLRANRKGSGLYRLAKRTLVSAVVCLLVSFANLLTLIVVGGAERGVTCLLFCTADVTINVLTIHWVTNGHDSKKQLPTGKQAANVSRSNDNDDLSPYRSAVKVDVQIMPAKEEDYMDEDVHSIQTSQTSGKPLNYDDDEKV
ncbi:hypothetical protein BC943DRAFT_314763 [Umbelopsis sp. AD052]|nr:hypothetical protein BC943DRAFT_314763 [Umbelopsis sp. AD052]